MEPDECDSFFDSKGDVEPEPVGVEVNSLGMSKSIINASLPFSLESMHSSPKATGSSADPGNGISNVNVRVSNSRPSLSPFPPSSTKKYHLRKEKSNVSSHIHRSRSQAHFHTLENQYNSFHSRINVHKGKIIKKSFNPQESFNQHKQQEPHLINSRSNIDFQRIFNQTNPLDNYTNMNHRGTIPISRNMISSKVSILQAKIISFLSQQIYKLQPFHIHNHHHHNNNNSSSSSSSNNKYNSNTNNDNSNNNIKSNDDESNHNESINKMLEGIKSVYPNLQLSLHSAYEISTVYSSSEEGPLSSALNFFFSANSSNSSRGEKKTIQTEIFKYLLAEDLEKKEIYFVIPGTRLPDILTGSIADIFYESWDKHAQNDLKADLKLEGAAISDSSGKVRGRVHAGFMSRVCPNLVAHIESLWLDDEKKMFICGHSLGGSVAHATLASLLTKLPKQKFFSIASITAVALGSPYVADKDLSNYIQENGFTEEFVTIVNNHDGIPLSTDLDLFAQIDAHNSIFPGLQSVITNLATSLFKNVTKMINYYPIGEYVIISHSKEKNILEMGLGLHRSYNSLNSLSKNVFLIPPSTKSLSSCSSLKDCKALSLICVAGRENIRAHLSSFEFSISLHKIHKFFEDHHYAYYVQLIHKIKHYSI